MIPDNDTLDGIAVRYFSSGGGNLEATVRKLEERVRVLEEAQNNIATYGVPQIPVGSGELNRGQPGLFDSA